MGNSADDEHAHCFCPRTLLFIREIVRRAALRCMLSETCGTRRSSPRSVRPVAAKQIIEQLIDAGVDICRLNFSHGTQDAHAETFHRIRAAAARAKKVVSILQDLSGPKIRTGRLKGGQARRAEATAQTIRIVAGDGEGDAERIYTTYAELVRKARPGGQLLLDDGKIQLRSSGPTAREIVAKRGRGRHARRAQGHQRAGRAAVGRGADAEGHRRSRSSARSSASTWWR